MDGKLALTSSVLILLIIQSSNAVRSTTIDYCHKDLCNSVRHIACGNNNQFSSRCHQDRKVIPLTPELKSGILNSHNEFRNKIAMGKLDGYEPAVQMPEMTWDETLAKLAEMNAKTCKFAHDECRNTDKFRFAGQNLAMISSSNEITNLRKTVKNMITMWTNESSDANMEIIKSFSFPNNGKQIGHFTQVVRDKAMKVGCAFTSFSSDDNQFKNLYLVCNYSMTNMMGRPVYVTGGEMASKCNSGVSKKFRGLCSRRERLAPIP